MEKIKIAHIITKLELGGAQQNTLFTLKTLDRDKFMPVLITGNDGMLLDEALRLDGVKTYLVPQLIREISPIKDLAALYKIFKILRSTSPMIVHTHSSKAGIIGRWAAFLAGVPIIIHTIHGFGFNVSDSRVINRLLILLERLTARITDRFIAVARENIKKGESLKIFKKDKIRLIRSGIDISGFMHVNVDKVAKKMDLGVHPDIPLIGMLACLKPQKAPVDFIRMADLVCRRFPHVNFIIIGDGELQGEVIEAISSSGLNDRVILAGWRRDIPEMMRAMDIFVLTSRWEGLPRVLLEAMVSGLPIVATRVDGTSEVIIDGVNGYLVEPADVKGMAERVIRLLSDPVMARMMGRAGQDLPKEFDINYMVSQLGDLYIELILNKTGYSPRKPAKSDFRIEHKS